VATILIRPAIVFYEVRASFTKEEKKNSGVSSRLAEIMGQWIAA
jgi:hypothetical protein